MVLIRQTLIILVLLLTTITYLGERSISNWSSLKQRFLSTTTATSSTATTISVNNNTTLPKPNKKKNNVTILIHFHKAGGTSLIKMFLRTRRAYRPHKNGNPWGWNETTQQQYLVPFWRYDYHNLKAFLDAQNKVQFLSMEWNFFTSLHQTLPHRSSSSSSSPSPKQLLLEELGIELITCLRDPFTRFVSNLFFDSSYTETYRRHPLEQWSTNLDLWWSMEGSKYLNCPPGGACQHDFPVNYNKPNYYVAFLNGLADQKYDWRQLNESHLEVAKQRLRDWFWTDNILILEQPQTHEKALQHWFDSPNVKLEHYNRGNYQGGKNHNNRTIGMSRQQFNQLNSLDVELYQYAIDLVTTTTGTKRQQQQQQQQQQSVSS